MPLLPGFKKLFPGITPVPLVASVLFFTPIIRDFVSWCGVRQVRCMRACPCLQAIDQHMVLSTVTHMLHKKRACSMS